MAAEPGKQSNAVSSPETSRLNWDLARARLESAAAATGNDTTATNNIEGVLQRRAQTLARPQAQPAGAAEGGDNHIVILAFQLSGQVFAVPAEFVREAMTVSQITRLPGMPSTLRGLANVRSRIVPAFDLQTLLGISERAELPEREMMLILDFEGAEFGILVDDVIGARTVDPAQLRHGIPGLQTQFMRGLAEDGLVLIDLTQVFAVLSAGERIS